MRKYWRYGGSANSGEGLWVMTLVLGRIQDRSDYDQGVWLAAWEPMILLRPVSAYCQTVRADSFSLPSCHTRKAGPGIGCNDFVCFATRAIGRQTNNNLLWMTLQGFTYYVFQAKMSFIIMCNIFFFPFYFQFFNWPTIPALYSISSRQLSEQLKAKL